MSALIEFLAKRTSSIFLFSYVIFYAIWHWQTICTALFVDQDLIYKKFGLLKNEYISQYLCDDSPLGLAIGFGAPALLALAYVLLSPLVYTTLYRYEVRFRTKRQICDVKEEQKILAERAKVTKQQAEVTKNEADIAEDQARAKKADPEATMRAEFEEFMRLDGAEKAMREFDSVIYEHNGDTSDTYGSEFITSNSLKLGDLYGLYHQSLGNNIILTDKGRYFLKEYTKRRG